MIPTMADKLKPLTRGKERPFCRVFLGKLEGDLAAHIVSVFQELTKSTWAQI